MKINLFEESIFIGNIDSSKIKLKTEDFYKTWDSETLSSFSSSNELDQDSALYLLEIIAKLLKEKTDRAFKLNLINIWQNNYIQNDFQEKHAHPHSHFSFIIYKKIKESKTVFYNPIFNLIQSFYDVKFVENSNFFQLRFETECRENQIVVFPSYLEHMVKKNGDSSTISGNLRLEII
jgi:hypothetical protein